MDLYSVGLKGVVDWRLLANKIGNFGNMHGLKLVIKEESMQLAIAIYLYKKNLLAINSDLSVKLTLLKSI